MKKNEKGFSLIMVVIFMSIAALFVGYLMGSWLISFLVEDDKKEMALEKKNQTNVNQPLNSETNSQAEEFNNQKTKLNTSENKKTETITQNKNTNKSINDEIKNNQSDLVKNESKNSSKGGEADSAFAVQIGAFSNYNNALTLKKKVEGFGYEIFITNTTPHQVQVVGYSSRTEAEQILEELKSRGYNGFIVIRE